MSIEITHASIRVDLHESDRAEVQPPTAVPIAPGMEAWTPWTLALGDALRIRFPRQEDLRRIGEALLAAADAPDPRPAP